MPATPTDPPLPTEPATRRPRSTRSWTDSNDEPAQPPQRRNAGLAADALPLLAGQRADARREADRRLRPSGHLPAGPGAVHAQHLGEAGPVRSPVRERAAFARATGGRPRPEGGRVVAAGDPAGF